jgi:hypothetical protein
MNEEAPPNISAHTNPISAMVWINAFAIFLFSVPSMSIVLFLRHRFGCRFIKLWMPLLVFVLLFTAYSLGSGLTDPNAARLYGVAMMGLAVMHSRNAWRRFWGAAKEPRELWHSESDGISHLRPFVSGVSERVLRGVVEPVLAVAVALLCLLLAFSISGAFFLGLGMWLLTAGVFHALYEAMVYEQRLNLYVDFVDGQINSMAMLEMQEGFEGGIHETPRPEDSLGNPVVVSPDVFKVMAVARQRADQARAAAAERQKTRPPTGPPTPLP